MRGAKFHGLLALLTPPVAALGQPARCYKPSFRFVLLAVDVRRSMATVACIHVDERGSEFTPPLPSCLQDAATHP